MAARAWPGAAAGSKWSLELAPEPQNARKVLLEPAPEPQNARKVPLEPALEPQNARKVSLEPAPAPQQARKVPLEPTAVRCVRFLRSKSAVFCSSVIGINFCSAPLCSVGLGLAGAFELAARALSASLGRSTGQSRTKTNRTRTGQAYSETLRRAGPRMPVALNTETNILRAWNARVRTSIHIYIYV